VYTVLFSLLLVPKSFLVIAHETTINSVLNPIIMIVLLAWTLFLASVRLRVWKPRTQTASRGGRGGKRSPLPA
ncbi:MAG: hypothetical protein ACKOWG_09355, partial [Planctomycetia bacterium]